MEDRRVFLIVLDSFGIGYEPDADRFGDVGANTLRTIAEAPGFDVPNLKTLGLFNIDGVDAGSAADHPAGAFGRLREASRGKDTTTGHWEIAGLITQEPMPTFPDGFPDEVIRVFTAQTGRAVLCNRTYSGTEVIRDFGEEHLRTGALIVYTSADSVFQIAAHEDVVPVQELYRYCEIARGILQGPYGVGRVIARPFRGKAPDFVRTADRHDFSLQPPGETMCDALLAAGYDTCGIGKIYDIFAGRGISHTVRTRDNADGMQRTLEHLLRDFRGLCFVNLVDFDMVYGHRNDIAGYAAALMKFDRWLPEFIAGMRETDLLMVTADHGCDPGFPGTDHTREYVPLLACGAHVRPGVDLGTRSTFADIAATILDLFGVKNKASGNSFKAQIYDERR